MLGGALMSKMRNMVLEAVQMNGIENVIMPLIVKPQTLPIIKTHKTAN